MPEPETEICLHVRRQMAIDHVAHLADRLDALRRELQEFDQDISNATFACITMDLAEAGCSFEASLAHLEAELQ